MQRKAEVTQVKEEDWGAEPTDNLGDAGLGDLQWKQ